MENLHNPSIEYFDSDSLPVTGDMGDVGVTVFGETPMKRQVDGGVHT